VRRLPALLALLALFACPACGGGTASGGSARLTLVEGEAERHLAVPAWTMPSAGRVVGLGGTPGDLLVAQRLQLSRLEPDGSSASVLALPSGSSFVALSLHGRRVAFEDAEGIHAGRTGRYDPGSTALSGSPPHAGVLVLDGHPARLFQGRLWDLDVPRMVWWSHAYGQISAIDPTRRYIVLGEEEGRAAVISAHTGRREWNVHRRSPASTANEIAALAITTEGEVANLDRAGWVSCGGGSVPLFPLAPPDMPAAIAFRGKDVWATRGGIAVLVECGPGEPRRVCEIRGRDGDPRSPALVAIRGRVYAAGLKRGKIVLLPRCE